MRSALVKRRKLAKENASSFEHSGAGAGNQNNIRGALEMNLLTTANTY